jgi:hypothetical protein
MYFSERSGSNRYGVMGIIVTPYSTCLWFDTRCDTGYDDEDFFVIVPFPPGRCWDSKLKRAVLCNHPFIRLYATCVVDEMFI